MHALEAIDGRAAMLFHAFCDNENAPYKDSIIIFTVHVSSDVIENEEEVCRSANCYDTHVFNFDPKCNFS